MSKHNPLDNPLVLSRQFNDLDRFREAIKPSNITECTQLSPGSFLGTINFADFGNLKFTHLYQNQATKGNGRKPIDDIGFAMVFHPNLIQASSHGCAVGKYDLFGFDPTREVDIVADKDVHLVMTSVNKCAFYTLSEQMGYNLTVKVMQNNALRLHPTSLRPLRAFYEEITHVFNTQTSLLMQLQMQSLIMEDFLPLLINTFGKGIQKKERILKPFRRYSLVKKAEEISKSYRDKPLTLQKLCQELQTSRLVMVILTLIWKNAAGKILAL
ncbi:hypothetical protein H6G47_16805 [Aphanizomenon flos-aquae FACHB-1416]|uniref:hypothetical protein n=1 Tax=Aphanizomenon flos-aquae TaxID=1176 RepID=UPI001681D062|nr:hypothetical protein [Aphanizomenon flos-aquae]MBD2675495.1 hypothetical protein [Aphanizomenon flos-aquae FACHB-1416]